MKNKMLVVDCCIMHGESSTEKFYKSYVDKVKDDFDVEVLKLYDEPLRPYLKEDIKKRDALLEQKAFDDDMFRYARQFAAADEIVIAAPYWDLSFPSLLKIYFEHITVFGLTFAYGETGAPVKLCKATTLRYFSTLGGYVKDQGHQGVDYIRAMAGMYNIPNFFEYHIDGLDRSATEKEKALNEGIEKMLATL